MLGEPRHPTAIHVNPSKAAQYGRVRDVVTFVLKYLGRRLAVPECCPSLALEAFPLDGYRWGHSPQNDRKPMETNGWKINDNFPSWNAMEEAATKRLFFGFIDGRKGLSQFFDC